MANNDSAKKDGKKPAAQKPTIKKSTAQKPVSAFSSSSSSGGEEESIPTTSRKAQNLPGDMKFRPGSSAFNSSCSGGSSNGGTQPRNNTPPSSGQIKGSPDNSPRTKEKHRNAALDSLNGKKPKK